jgi:DNA repair photolyase
MRQPQPSPIRKGRGAWSNASGRYERISRHAFDDGWTDADPAAEKRPTTVTIETAKTIITRNTSPDLSFDRTINPYRGCEHGCFYCYARPNHAYAGLSPGLDFETRLFAKTNAAAVLERELAGANYQPKTLVLGGVTDVYQPIERTYGLTRACLTVLARCHHPIALVTKSQLVLRDVDILAGMAARNLAKVALSITTLDPKLARKMEPRAAAPHRRIETVRLLASAGTPVCVMVAPIIPGLNDHELESILAAAAGAGAREAGYVLLRLPLEIKTLAREWLAAHAPDRAAKVIHLLQDMRGGRDYDANWSTRQKGVGPYANLIAGRFRRACRALGLNANRVTLDTYQFRRPVLPGGQHDLF